MNNYIDSPLKEYLDDLASNLPAPGGGSASALVGSTGVALFCMVANFTVGKEKYAEVEDEVRAMLKKLESIRKRLDELVEEDILSYSEVSGAYKLPKNTDEEKKARSEAIQEACKKALGVPMEIASNCSDAMLTGRRLLEIGNRNLVSDVGVGAVQLEAALNGAAMNVNVNLAIIRDEEYVNQKKKELEKLLDGKADIKNEIVGGMNF